MSISIDGAWLLALFLATVRAGAWMMIAPPFSNTKIIPKPVALGIAAGLGLMGAAQVQAHGLPTDTATLVGSILVQVIIGSALGLVVQIVFNVFASGGALVDMFGGLNPPPSIDPLSENQSPILGTVYEQIAIVLLFVSNAEMLLIKGFEGSFAVSNIDMASTPRFADVMIGDLATLFKSSLEIAAPICAVLFITQISIGLVAKAAPQVNAWFLGLPVQVMLSLGLAAIGVKFIPFYLNHALERMFSDFRYILGS